MKRLLPLFLVLCSAGAMAQTKQFSADMVEKEKPGDTDHSRIYVGAGKVRIDRRTEHSIAIVDYDSLKLYMLMQQEKAYMEMKLNDPKSDISKSFALFAPSVANDPCAQWKKIVTDLTCRKVATENLNGRTVDKWEGSSTRGGKGFLWFDPKLQFIVKLDSEERTIEFLNIQEGPQPASLFAVPSGYHKMEMGQPPH